MWLAATLVMAKIFISYRRSDTSAVSGRIYDRLIEVLDASEVFKDVDDIPLGSNFKTVITEKIGQSETVLVLIGKEYCKVANEDGSLRLFDNEDPVRIEVVTALASNARVIPVLAEGAKMPQRSELPEDMHELVDLNAASILPDPHFHTSFDSFLKSLNLASKPSRAKRGALVAFAIVAALLVWIFWPSEKPIPNIDRPDLNGDTVVDTPDIGGVDIPVIDSVGYDKDFLGPRHTVELPTITDAIASSIYKQGQVFNYPHFSLVMNQDRSMAHFTAHNFDRSDVVKLERDAQWYLDDRLPSPMQRDNDLYIRNDLDRGHLVPFVEVGWGDLAKHNPEKCKRGVNSFTNTTPQHKDFNRWNWGALEKHIRYKLEDTVQRFTVFTGPIFRDDDLEVRGTKVPQSYWKVVVTRDVKSSTRLRVHAFEVPHYKPQGITPVFAEKIRGADAEKAVESWRIPLPKLEALTGLDFGYIRQYDVMKISGLVPPGSN